MWLLYSSGCGLRSKFGRWSYLELINIHLLLCVCVVNCKITYLGWCTLVVAREFDSMAVTITSKKMYATTTSSFYGSPIYRILGHVNIACSLYAKIDSIHWTCISNLLFPCSYNHSADNYI